MALDLPEKTTDLSIVAGATPVAASAAGGLPGTRGSSSFSVQMVNAFEQCMGHCGTWDDGVLLEAGSWFISGWVGDSEKAKNGNF